MDKDDFNLLVDLFNRRAKSDVIGIPYDEFQALGKAIDTLRPLVTGQYDRIEMALEEIVDIRDEELEGTDGARLANIARRALKEIAENSHDEQACAHAWGALMRMKRRSGNEQSRKD